MNEKLYLKPTNDSEDEFVGPQNDSSDVSNLQRYSLSKLYSLRYTENSQRRPELRAELQTLSFWKFNNNGQTGNLNESGVGGDSEHIGIRPQRQINFRDRPMSYTRTGRGDSIVPVPNLAPKANFMDHRSNSIAHLMPAFAKKRIEAAAAASQQNNSGASSSCEDIEVSRSVNRLDQSNVNTNCTKGLAKFQPTIRSNSPRRTMGRHLGNENDDFLSNLSSPNARQERRIGSGRLLHREASWEYHDKNSASIQKHPGSNPRYAERSNAPLTPSRGFDRRCNSNSSGDVLNSQKNTRRLNTVSSDEQRPHRRSYNDRNDEPEWFSGGPTSQNDTIELRGFDDSMESNDHSEQGQAVCDADHDTGFRENLEEEDQEIKTSPSLNAIDTSLGDQEKRNEKGAESNEPELISKEFNFDAFLNLDPLDPDLMRSDTSTQNEMLPVASRFKRWFATKEKCDEIVQSTDSKIAAETPRPPNVLLEFIQQTKTSNSLELGHLQRMEMPSVEELEARMRKVDVKDNDDARSTDMLETDQQKFQPAAQDMEAFKKLLEQLNNADGNRNSNEENREQLRSNCMQTSSNAGILPPSHHLGIFSAAPPPPSQLVSITPVAVPPPQPALPNNDRISQMQQQQPHQQIQPHQFPFINPHQPIPPALIAEAEQKRREFVNLLHAVNRGHVPLVFLEKELNSPNTLPHTKEIISAVLRECTRSMTPSIGQLPPPVQVMRTSPMHHQQDMHSPVPMMNVIAHPQPNRDIIPIGGPPLSGPPPIGMQGPNPQELHIRTQAIFQNAMLKKKMEDQLQQQQHQEGLNRRNEVHKPQEETSSSQLYQVSQSQGSTPPHGQNRSLNSPTPLAFTPTSVLRKMTAEKDNTGSQQHQQVKSSAQLQNKAFPHQQQLPTVQLPRMILGGGNNAAPSQQNQLLSSPISPQAAPPLHQQRMPPSDMKWQAINLVLNQPGPTNVGMYGNVATSLPLPTPLQKPMGRPILKGPPPVLTQMSQQQQPQVPSMMFSPTTKIDQQQHQQRLKNNQTPQHMFNQNQQQMQQGFAAPGQGPAHLQPSSQPSQSMLHMQQHQPSPPQLFQLHQMSVQQQQQMQLQRQLHQQHHPQQRESAPNQVAGNSALNTNVENLNSNNSGGQLVNNSRDGGLSPTSNQLAQWFSPELLAQASAGKLPQINVNQALSLEEFERNIQQHSSIVHN